VYSNVIFIFMYSIVGIFTFRFLYKQLIYFFQASKTKLKHVMKITICYLLILSLTCLCSQKAASSVFPILNHTGIQFKLLASIMMFMVIILNSIWTITNLYIINKLPNYTTYIKSIILGLFFISIIVVTTILIYGNIYQDYNNFYLDKDLHHEHGIFKNSERVSGITNFLYFSSVVIFRIGIDEVNIVGADLKWIVMSEMFLSYLLMSIFVPSIITLLDPKDNQKKKNKVKK